MTNKTKRRIRPMLLASSVLGIVAMLAVLASVVLPSGSAQAQDLPTTTKNAGTTTTPGGQTSSPAAKCEINVNAAGNLVSGGTPLRCVARGDTMEVVFKGDDTATEDVALSLLILDASGPITAYPNGTTWNGDELVDAHGESAISMQYRFQSITLAEARVNPSTGMIEGQKVSVLAKGDVYVWAGSVSVTRSIADIPFDNVASGSREIAYGSEKVSIILVPKTVVGPPALGKDGYDPGDTLDAHEVRSWLDAHVGTEFDVTATPRVSVIDGGISTELVVPEGHEEVRVRATIKDADNNPLADQEVKMALTGVPSGIVRTFPYDEDTGADGTAVFKVDSREETEPFRITAKFTVGNLELGSIIVIRPGDLDNVMAEACYEVAADKDVVDDGCMDGYNAQMVYGPGDSFSIYAEATDSLGTKVVPDTFIVKPATVATWWDNLDCTEMNDSVISTDDEPAAEPDDSTSPYCKMYDELSEEAKYAVIREFDNSYGDATEAFNFSTAGKPLSYDGLVVLTVDDYAPGAKYLLDVVATDGWDADMVVSRDQISVMVAGNVDSYVLDGPKYIALNGYATYTVMALDENGNPPIFEPGKNKVRVLFQPNTLLVTNLIDGELTLDEHTGIGKFTVYAPLVAAEGDPGRLIIDSGSILVVTNIFFGEEPPESTIPGMPMNVNAMAEGYDTIKVTWDAPSDDGNSDITGYMVQSTYMMADDTMSEWTDVDPVHIGTDGMYMDSGLTAEITYYYRVAAMNSVGMGEYSDGTAYAMTEIMPVLGVPGVTGAVSNAVGMATISIIPAANADRHFVRALPTDYSNDDGIFSDAAPGDATSVEMSGLASGKSYWFTVVAGMDIDDVTTEMSWATTWTGAVTIQ